MRARVKDFRLAEATDTRKEFYAKTYSEWLQGWPNPEPTQKEIENAGSIEKAINIIYKRHEKVRVLASIHVRKYLPLARG